MGENSRGGSRDRDRQCRGRSVHDRRQRRDGESRRIFPGDNKEGDSRAADRI